MCKISTHSEPANHTKGPISPIWEKGDRPKNPFREKGERLKKAKKFREKGEREIILGEGRRGLH